MLRCVLESLLALPPSLLIHLHAQPATFLPTASSGTATSTTALPQHGRVARSNMAVVPLCLALRLGLTHPTVMLHAVSALERWEAERHTLQVRRLIDPL